MTAQAPKPDETTGRVIRFEPRRAPPRPPATPPAADLRQFTQRNARPHEDREDYRHRMKANAAALVVVAALIWCGYWLFDSLAEMRRNQDCALTGRATCTPIKVPVEPR